MYNFLPALTAIDPYHTYTTIVLSGGITNLTVRVRIAPALKAHECIFRGAETVIAKYAPPYVAALGEGVPFSQYRQVIEARALALLSQSSLSAYTQSIVATPQLVYYDSIFNILLMTDMGEIPTLDQWLRSESSSAEQAEAVGKRFGEFLARLSKISEYIDEEHKTELDLTTHFSNPSSEELIRSVAVLPVESNLIRCGVDPAEASSLGKVCLDMCDHQQRQGRTKVFGLGDCWPKSLLVGGVDRLSVIDWEFARMMEPLGDLAQLAAHLFLLYRTSPASAKPKIRSYALSMFRAHYTCSRSYYTLGRRVEACMLFGQEVINNAVEMYWWNGDENRREAEMGSLAKVGMEFVKDAEKRGRQDAVLFGSVFEKVY